MKSVLLAAIVMFAGVGVAEAGRPVKKSVASPFNNGKLWSEMSPEEKADSMARLRKLNDAEAKAHMRDNGFVDPITQLPSYKEYNKHWNPTFDQKMENAHKFWLSNQNKKRYRYNAWVPLWE